ncbi:MAG TPA: RNA polymerase sigma factor WhiG [Actinomycetota bacterium]|nr:RNA polymerase sigma factor WhiG [Actinomycetota bacterium]
MEQRPDGAYLQEVWRSYKEDGSLDARDRLILHYSPLVKFVAGRVGAGLPSTVETADLVSYGILGLIDALAKFEVDRGIKFETYAIPRIRGAILDELRALDWVPRSVRSKARELQRAMGKLEAELRRTPEDEELARELGIGVDELHDRLDEVATVSVVALEELLTVGGERGERVSLLDTLPDLRTESPGERMEADEAREALLEAIQGLRERERWVIALYYFEGMTLAQIGQTLGVTESRVSQIHSKAVLSLRNRLGGDVLRAAPSRGRLQRR